MYPTLFKIGDVSIRSYPVMIAIGLSLGSSPIINLLKKHDLDLSLYIDCLMYLMVSFFLGARLLFVIVYYEQYISSPLRILKFWEGGFVYYGGVLGVFVVGSWLVTKRSLSPWLTADIILPLMIIGLAFGRIGCFLSGCCHGIPTDLPWATSFPYLQNHDLTGVPIHPTQLYSSAFLFGLFAWLLYLHRSGYYYGRVTIHFCLLYPVFRFFIEFFRGDTDRGEILGISTSQFISLLIFVTGIGLLIYHRQKAE